MLLRLLTTYLRPYRRELGAVVVLQLVSTVASLFLPSLNADIIDRGVVRTDTPYILRTGALMLGITVVQVAASVAAVWFGAWAAMGLGRDVRSAFFRRVGTFSSQEVQRFGAPTLITRNTNDVQQVQLLVLLSATLLVTAPIMSVGGIVMAVRQDAGLSWLLVVAIPVMIVAVLLVVRHMVPLFRVVQVRIDAVNRVLREQLTGIRVMRAFVREPHETQRFGGVNAELTDTQLRVGRLQVLIQPVVLLVLNASTVAVLWFGAGRIDAGQMQIGSLTAFLNYLVQILTAVLSATFMVILIPRASVSAGRIVEVLDTTSSVVSAQDPVAPAAGRERSTVDLRGVTFCYPGAESPVLRDVDLHAQAGRTTAIIGSTGSGKTTLLSLVPRLFDATSGTVEVGGVDVREQAPEALWGRIGFVPQKPYLFTGTVASNLRYGKPDATDEELWAALEVAQASGFVRAMGEGLDTPITQGGTNVSGGQRQRLAIARAVVRRPSVYLFDDSFSALDLTTDARLRAALRPVTADAAVVLVAQRVSSIVEADTIVVLEDGAVVGTGTHEQLLTTCPTYVEIVDSQVSAEASA